MNLMNVTISLSATRSMKNTRYGCARYICYICYTV